MTRLTTLACTALLLAVSVLGALAQTNPNVHNIYMGGYVIMRIRTGSDELSLKERKLIVQQRVTNLMKCSDSGDISVTVRKNGNDYDVIANNQLIITVSKDDANANKTSTLRQARMWAMNIKDVFPKAIAACTPPEKQP